MRRPGSRPVNGNTRAIETRKSNGVVRSLGRCISLSADEGRLALFFLHPGAEVGLDVGLVQRLGVGEAHVGRLAHEVQAALLQLRGVGVLEHDLVAALAVDLVGGDVQVEELGLPLREPVLVDQRGVLGAVDRGHLRLQAHDQRRGGHHEVLPARHVVHPALHALGEGHGVVAVLHVGPGASARLGEADQQVGVAVVAEFFLVHVLQEEVLGVAGVVGRVGVHEAEVVAERADVVVVVGGPVNEVLLVQLAGGPGPAERGVLGHGARECLL